MTQINGSTILPVKLPTCGTCQFGKTVQLGIAECWGLPPTPVVLGGKPNMAGQIEMHVELMRPRQDARTAGCALWREKDLVSQVVGGQA